METMIEAIAERVARGGAVDDADARAIVASHDLIAITMMADDVRRRRHGARTTFLRVFEIHGDAVPPALPPAFSAGEVRIVGRPVSGEAAVAAVRQAAALAPGVPLSGFSLADLAAVASEAGITVDSLCASLRAAGLDLVAEAPVAMPDLAPAVEAARRAGLAVTRLTVTRLEDEERIAAAVRARDIQHALGGFRAFAPLPREASITRPSTGYDDLKQVALARLLAADIASIQVDWVLYGPKLAQVALTAGADDVDGVTAVESGALGTRRSAIEEIRGNIRAASLEPVERNARWEAAGA
jgi:aminodeoxyfutalosine synthase